MEEYIEHQVKNKVKKFFRGFFKVLFMLIAAIVFLLLFGYVFMWLWNWLMPDIFGLTTLTYWQAFGLLVLAKLVFGSFGGHKSGNRSKKFKDRCKQRGPWAAKNGLSKWKHYDRFWEEEGERAYQAYVTRKAAKNDGKPEEDGLTS